MKIEKNNDSEESSDEKLPSEEHLGTFRTSRKVYFLEYCCGTLLMLLIVISYFKGIILRESILYFILSLALASFVFAEVSRILTKYQLTSKKLIIIRGLLKQDRTNVYFHPLVFVPDINIKQNRLQRILNFGTISIHGEDAKSSFEIKDIDQPHQVMRILEKLIEKNKYKSGRMKR